MPPPSWQGRPLGADGGADAVGVDRPAEAGAVEIDEMEEGGALLRPTAGDGSGVGVENGFACVVALDEAYALTAAEGRCREDLHADPSIRGVGGSLPTGRVGSPRPPL